MTEGLAHLIQHLETCAVCTKANKRVNDFCDIGRLLFAEYKQTARPYRVEEVFLNDEQYERLLAESKRARKRAEEN